jgi:hypothetical protein
MSESAISVGDSALEKLRELSEWSGKSVAEELEHAITAYHNQQFWVAVNAGYAALRENVQAWSEELAERRAWEQTLMDGLDPSEHWAEDGTLLSAPDEGKAG